MSDLYGVDASRRPTDYQPRCRSCGRLFADFITRPWRLGCPRCKTLNGSTALQSTAYPENAPRDP